MKFCSQCGTAVESLVPEGDHRQRHVCPNCGVIHYQNPKIVVGCVPEHEGRILLCKRAIEPRLGFWTVPAGFMENGETLEAGAARECFEEACARVDIGSLLALVNVVHAHQVHVFFRARLAVPGYGIGAESLEVKLLSREEIPWPDLAFPSTEFALRHYFADQAAGAETVHLTEVERPSWRRTGSG